MGWLLLVVVVVVVVVLSVFPALRFLLRYPVYTFASVQVGLSASGLYRAPSLRVRRMSCLAAHP